MAAGTAPIFPKAVRNAGVSVVGASAVTARTAIAGTTGLTLAFTPGADGSRIDTIRTIGTGTTLAGLVDYWVYDGATSRLLREVLVSVVTPSTTTPAFTDLQLFDDLVLPSTHALYMSSQVASQLVGCIVSGGDY